MSDKYYKNIYSHKEFYNSLLLLFKSIKPLKLNKEAQHVSPQFKERIMLAVTEVNGCEACSYAHTKFALEEGMDKDEIKAILSGDLANIPDEEIPAIMFAQHYADEKGAYSPEAWQRLVAEYGEEKAEVILAMIRVMMSGNIYGMSISALKDRFKGKPSGKTSLFYELSILLSIIIYLPAAKIHSLFLKNNMN